MHPGCVPSLEAHAGQNQDTHIFVINIQDRTEGKLYDTVLPDICDKMKNYESVSDEGSLAGLSADRFPEEFAGNHNIVIHEENDSNMTQYEENA